MRPATLRSSEAARDDHVVAPMLRSHLPNLGLAALRVVAGLMFMQHGVQKYFGVLLAPGQPPFGHIAPLSALGIAGALELLGGALIVLGFFTRPVAFLLSGEMAVAYFTVHAKRGLFPIVNGGELAVLYCFIFLMFFMVGGGRFSVDQLIRRRRASREEPVEAEERSAVG
jgi:putative oxidoreductase